MPEKHNVFGILRVTLVGLSPEKLVLFPGTPQVKKKKGEKEKAKKGLILSL